MNLEVGSLKRRGRWCRSDVGVSLPSWNRRPCYYWLPIGTTSVGTEPDKSAVRQGTLTLMVLKTLATMGPLHGYGLARRIEQTSGHRLALNYGTIYPMLLKLEQEGAIVSEWGVSENNRKAKFYKLSRAGRRQVERETKQWAKVNEILDRFLIPEKP